MKNVFPIFIDKKRMGILTELFPGETSIIRTMVTCINLKRRVLR